MHGTMDIKYLSRVTDVVLEHRSSLTAPEVNYNFHSNARWGFFPLKSST